jgi:hypothetical protein
LVAEIGRAIKAVDRLQMSKPQTIPLQVIRLSDDLEIVLKNEPDLSKVEYDVEFEISLKSQGKGVAWHGCFIRWPSPEKE